MITWQKTAIATGGLKVVVRTNNGEPPAMIVKRQSSALTSKQVLMIFDCAWSEKYGVKKYGAFTRADGKLAQRLITSLPDMTDARLLLWIMRYLKQDDEFVVNQGHKFGTFVYRINTFRGLQQQPRTRETAVEALDSAAQQFAAGRTDG